MKIELGDYIINGDKFSLWVEKLKETTNKDGEKVKVPKRITGYYNKYPDLLESFVKLNLMDDEATTIKEFLQHIVTTEKELKDLARVLGEAYKEKLVIPKPVESKK